MECEYCDTQLEELENSNIVTMQRGLLDDKAEFHPKTEKLCFCNNNCRKLFIKEEKIIKLKRRIP